MFSIIVLLVLITTSVRRAGANEVPGDFQLYSNPIPAGDLRMATPEGGLLRLSDLRGSVVILNFWRKDCPYCVTEKGSLRTMLQSLGRSDLKVVCADFWDSPAWVKSFGKTGGKELVVTARPIDFNPVVENKVKGRLMGYFVLNDAQEAVYEVKGFPSSYVIDKKGDVIAFHHGMAVWTSTPVKNWLKKVLDERGDTPVSSEIGPAISDWLERLLVKIPTAS
jgi:thiol-disulfide isomerase/thioredoxin